MVPSFHVLDWPQVRYRVHKVYARPISFCCVAHSCNHDVSAEYTVQCCYQSSQISRFPPHPPDFHIDRMDIAQSYIFEHKTMLDEKITNKTAVSPESDNVSSDVEMQGWDAASTKKLLRKLDWHIIRTFLVHNPSRRLSNTDAYETAFMSLIYLSVNTHFSQQD